MTQQQKKASGYIPKSLAQKKLQAKLVAIQAKIDERKKQPQSEELTAYIVAVSTPMKTSSPPIAPNHPHVAAVVQPKGILKWKCERQQEPSDT